MVVRHRTIMYVVLLVALYVPTALVAYLAFTTEYIPLHKYEWFRFIALTLLVPILAKYILQLLVTPLYSIAEYVRAKRRAGGYVPNISVVIPAWNEEVGVVRTVRSVLDTKYPKLEVIIINDGSTDCTHDTMTDFLIRYPHEYPESDAKLIYRRIKNGGKARAMNVALQIATGELFVTIDADSVMHEHTLKNLAKHFSDADVSAVAGNVVIGNRTQTLGLVQQLEYLYGFYFKRADSLFNAVYIVGGAAAAYRREVILQAGGFDENIITEDIELSTRLQRLGHKIRYAADAFVYTEGPSDMAGLCRQRLRWKYGRLLTFLKHRELFFSLKRGHRFYLTCIVLPIALFSELLLFFEWFLVGTFYLYTFYTNDYDALFFVLVFLASVVVLQVLVDPLFRHHRNVLWLAPGAWLLFYFIDMIEYQALLRSIKRLYTGTGLTWQRWTRVGVFGD